MHFCISIRSIFGNNSLYYSASLGVIQLTMKSVRSSVILFVLILQWTSAVPIPEESLDNSEVEGRCNHFKASVNVAEVVVVPVAPPVPRRRPRPSEVVVVEVPRRHECTCRKCDCSPPTPKPCHRCDHRPCICEVVSSCNCRPVTTPKPKSCHRCNHVVKRYLSERSAPVLDLDAEKSSSLVPNVFNSSGTEVQSTRSAVPSSKPVVKACKLKECCDQGCTDTVLGDAGSCTVSSCVGTTCCPVKDGDYPVYLAHPALRNVFYKCSWGKAYPFCCPDDTVFNPKLNVCDYQQ